MPDDFSADPQTTGVVTVGTPVEGRFDMEGDIDWLALGVSTGSAYRIHVEGLSADNGSASWASLLGLHDAAGVPTYNGVTFAEGDHIFYPPTDGTYFLNIIGNADLTLGGYRVSVTQLALPPDEAAADITTTVRVEVGGSAAGVVTQPQERDWFAVTLEAGTRYRITLTGAEGSVMRLNDPTIHAVRNADGTAIENTYADDFAGSLNSRLTFTPTETGTYYIEAGGFAGNIGAYQLGVTALPPRHDDVGHTATTAGQVTVGGSTDGVIEEEEDRDWFGVALEAGKHYRVDLLPRGEVTATRSDVYLEGILGADGSYAAATFDIRPEESDGVTARRYVSPTEDGTYYIAVSSYLATTPSYRVSVTEVDEAPVPPVFYPTDPIVWTLEEPWPHHPPPLPVVMDQPEITPPPVVMPRPPIRPSQPSLPPTTTSTGTPTGTPRPEPRTALETYLASRPLTGLTGLMGRLRAGSLAARNEATALSTSNA
ncbi:MAG TPA: PPC domain-containing protein [Azospirillaceae bacterium]|nr:PPC domain-containing protein [Azospirillaceae bacterium]